MYQQDQQVVTKKQTKVYTKLSKYIEEISIFSNSRQELKELLQDLKNYPNQGYNTLETEVAQAVLDEKGHPVKLMVQKQKRVFVSEQSKELHQKIKQKRSQILRLNKKASQYLNRVVQQIVVDFINSCEFDENTKNQEKSIGWRLFKPTKFESTTTGSLVRGCPTFCTLMDVKKTLRGLQQEKDIMRARTGCSQKKTIYQDIQKYKHILKEMTKNTLQQSEQYVKSEALFAQQQHAFSTLRKQFENEKQEIYKKIQSLDQVIDAEQINQLRLEIKNINKQLKEQKLDKVKNERNELLAQITTQTQHKLLETGSCDYSIEQLQTIMHIYNSIQYTQQETVESKKFLNDVKQAIKNHTTAKSETDETGERKTKKVTNGFKNFISNVVHEFLVGLCKRIEIYTDGSSNKNIKDTDLVKIVQLWSNSEQYQQVFESLKNLNSA